MPNESSDPAPLDQIQIYIQNVLAERFPDLSPCDLENLTYTMYLQVVKGYQLGLFEGARIVKDK